ncbi:MAG: transcription antitermination factor NusB [Bacteroidetes bacterium]|nr:transcription antitermination factor NusB [Bacteroidota bacterium]MBS1973881.1 transcription antitermination factor NusB [Bacteroidota bacterium]
MISRRNIRVKVMQVLYSLEARENSQKPGEDIRILQKHFDNTRQLFVYLIHFIAEVARYAETDSRVRASKHLPTDQDKNVNTRLAGNEVLWKMMEDASYQKAVALDKPQLVTDKELVKKIYQELAGTEEYKKYISTPVREKKSEKSILEFIFTELMLPNDFFVSHAEELFSNWDDDMEMLGQFVLAYLNKPQTVSFQDMLGKEKWDFARGLLQAVVDKKEITMELIKPKLKNWDAERIATLDMILMQMGVCEFLFFETIPPKVTINEYIDIAKEYSTEQSGHFVNGILDNIHKDLVKENKMHKVNFKVAKP